MTIALKENNITMTCKTAQEAHILYYHLGHDFTFVINGKEFEKMGRRADGSYFAGYTASSFKVFEKD